MRCPSALVCPCTRDKNERKRILRIYLQIEFKVPGLVFAKPLAVILKLKDALTTNKLK